jgi:hypothetical protein
MTDQELYDAFNSTALPGSEFHHEQHVRVAWMFVCRHGMPAALGEFSDAIKRFAVAKGAHGLYHETITWAFLLIINERQLRQPASTWDDFARANADLLSWKPSVLDRYYSTELLKSDSARRSFVMPDLIRLEPDTT